ncbi:PIG-L family deacetylase [Paenibacillus qinlingensis]|uniref:LmbE family N-acetylglucosaminyl deacetylase n=1 Tax=Paenibacillus qinlingensis TaxID=1837343 RepID=A0ABU1P5L5_9BACL|nr:PIG-L family deacetylase [Paenibacillus qinlingensis]MDR6554347.1 LmbE family N-acetylglucosaminyl deacetylase [Paenibacillus qinlingensis]
MDVRQGGIALKIDDWSGASSPPVGLCPVDLLIFAPHPDDEVLGTAGTIMNAIACGKRVHVVFFTNGDGYPEAATLLFNKRPEELGPSHYLELARVRQYETLQAAALIGLRPQDLTFLSYPDSGLDRVFTTTGATPPYQQRFTKQQTTYGALVPDFHSQYYGCPAPYRKACALGDTKALITLLQPKEIYTTDAADTHPDHGAAHAFVMEAASQLGYTGTIYTYLIHSGPESQWPWPRGVTPTLPFEAHLAEGQRYPMHVAWPPPIRRSMTQGQSYCKWQALLAYRSQIPVEPEFLQSFIKCEEIFWLPQLPHLYK